MWTGNVFKSNIAHMTAPVASPNAWKAQSKWHHKTANGFFGVFWTPWLIMEFAKQVLERYFKKKFLDIKGKCLD